MHEEFESNHGFGVILSVHNLLPPGCKTYSLMIFMSETRFHRISLSIKRFQIHDHKLSFTGAVIKCEPAGAQVDDAMGVSSKASESTWW